MHTWRVDRAPLSPPRETPQGVRFDGYITRSGVFPYRLPDGTIRRELRHPDDVKASLPSLEGVVVTNEHPGEFVRADSVRLDGVGWTGDRITMDADKVRGSLFVHDKDTIDQVRTGVKKEISAGYSVDLIEEAGVYNGERYDARQTNIQYNHVAIVSRGRAGPEVALRTDAAEQVADAAPALETTKGAGPMDPKERLDALEADLKSAQEAKEAADKAKAEMSKRVDSLQGELDALKEQVGSLKAEKEAAVKAAAERKDAAEFAEAVKARVALERVAGERLDAADLSALSDREIKCKVIEKASPKADLADKSDEYISARYDAALELLAVAADKSVGEGRKDAEDVKPTSFEAAREAHKAKMRNLWKSENAA